jgi:hypothetical protein
MYFKDFPTFLYDYDIKGEPTLKIVKDITRNTRFRRDVLANIAVYDQYDIIDGETPEIIAEKFYGNSNYHWIIMMVNERYDYISDFPLPQYQMEQFITQKYGVGNEYDTHHYVNANGFVVNSDSTGAASISNTEYEYMVNESKRRIKIIDIELLQKILQQFKEQL